MRFTHFGMLLQRRIPDDLVGKFQTECQPADVGEFWYDDYARGLLNSTCKGDCKRIQVSSFTE